jgi:hypothetical protein
MSFLSLVLISEFSNNSEKYNLDNLTEKEIARKLVRIEKRKESLRRKRKSRLEKTIAKTPFEIAECVLGIERKNKSYYSSRNENRKSDDDEGVFVKN